MTDLVSIIVPAYDAAAYLRDCIASILCQRYQNFELLLVNDGSTDDTLIVMQEYAAKDTRIRIVDKPNGGVSDARNAGIINSRGAYLAFVDADDTVDSDYIACLLENTCDGKLTLCGYHDFAMPQNFVYSSTEAVSVLGRSAYCSLYVAWLAISPCNKLYHAQTVKQNGISFASEISIGEDLLFNLNYIKHVDGFVVVNKPLYHYRHPNVESLSRIYRPEGIDLCSRRYQEILHFCRDEYHIAEPALSGIYEAYLSELLHHFALLRAYAPAPARQKRKKIRTSMGSSEFQDLLRHARALDLLHPLPCYLLKQKQYGLYRVIMQIHRSIKKRSAK